MKRTILKLVMLLLPLALAAQGSPEISPAMTQLAEKATYRTMVADSCTLRLGADAEYMYIQLDVPFPALQMHLLRHGFTIYIDPTNKKSEAMSIVMPHADDVMRMRNMDMPKPDGAIDAEAFRNMPRPDFTPVLQTVAKRGVFFITGDNSDLLPLSDVSVTMTPDYQLSYKVIVPIKDITAGVKVSKKWKLGLTAPAMKMPKFDGKEMPGFPGGGPGFGPPPGMGFGPPPGMGFGGPFGPWRQKSDKLMEMLLQGIDQWVTFKLKDIEIQ